MMPIDDAPYESLARTRDAPHGASRPTDEREDLEQLARAEKERRKQRRVSASAREFFAAGAQPPPPPPSDQPLPGRLFATLDATDSARLKACLASGVLTTAVDDLSLGLEARRQYELVERSGGVVRAHSLAVCPFDILVDCGEDLELCEFKPGVKTKSGTYDLVPDGVGVEEIGLGAKDVSKMCGVDLLEVQNDRPDGMRTLAVAHGQLALISTETVARAFAAGPALARNIFRRHNPVSGTCNADYFAVDDAAMSNVLMSRFDDVVVVLTTTLGGDLDTIEVHRDVIFSSDQICALGDANVSFKTIAEFERDTSLKIDGHDVDFAEDLGGCHVEGEGDGEHGGHALQRLRLRPGHRRVGRGEADGHDGHVLRRRRLQRERGRLGHVEADGHDGHVRRRRRLQPDHRRLEHVAPAWTRPSTRSRR